MLATTHIRVNEDGSIHFTLEMPVAEQVCPHCGVSTKKSKGKRPRDIKFGAIQHHAVTATYFQRCYKCQKCNHTFIEKNPFVCRYVRLSKTNMEYLFRQLGKKGSFTEIAKRSDVSVSTVIWYCSKLTIQKSIQLPTVLGIYSSQTFVTQPPKELFKKYSAIYSLGDLNPNTFCAMLLYLLAYR